MIKCLQETYAPKSVCYGCGPANQQGLHVQSFVQNNEVIAYWQPNTYHHAFPNILNGGVIGTLLDCHCNWAAAWYLMQAQDLPKPPSTVTAEYTIKLRKPAPMNKNLKLTATLADINKNIAVVHGRLSVEEIVYSSCVGKFVAVDADHPAFARW